MSQPPFHLAFPVHDLDAARAFYVDLLGCGVGRTSDTWIDFDFWGHQVVAHLAPDNAPVARNDVDGKQVPSRHFGVVVPWQEWEALGDTFKAAGCTFLVDPYVRFAGEVGEQGTLFIEDPSGNALEFKTFRDMDQLFAADDK